LGCGLELSKVRSCPRRKIHFLNNVDIGPPISSEIVEMWTSQRCV
jgi:hypothetical protein